MENIDFGLLNLFDDKELNKVNLTGLVILVYSVLMLGGVLAFKNLGFYIIIVLTIIIAILIILIWKDKLQSREIRQFHKALEEINEEKERE